MWMDSCCALASTWLEFPLGFSLLHGSLLGFREDIAIASFSGSLMVSCSDFGGFSLFAYFVVSHSFSEKTH